MMQVATKSSHHFSVSLKWDEESHNGITRAGNRMPILFAAPIEFGGTDTVWSPEHLLAASISSCYTTTFFYFAKLLKVDVHSFRLDVVMDIEKDDAGMFRATKFTLRPHIKFNIQPAEAMLNNLLSKSKRYCIISNSVKSEILVEATVED